MMVINSIIERLKILDIQKDSGVLTRFGEEIFWSAGQRGGFSEVSESRNIRDDDFDLLADATTEKIILTLPLSQQAKGQTFNIKYTRGTLGVEIATLKGELIDDSSLNFSLYLHESVTVHSDGVGWWII